MKRLLATRLAPLVAILSIFVAFSAHSAGLPEKGMVLPPLKFPSPTLPEDQKYLQVKRPTFGFDDVASQVLLVEIIGVYCPACYQQLPLFNTLFDRIQNGPLKNKVKMIAVAAGGTAMEVQFLRKDGQYKYPVLGDEKFSIHRTLGEPRTPFTMLVSKDGKVLYSHLGVIGDVDTFYASIKKLVE
jgi:hypothetical protein